MLDPEAEAFIDPRNARRVIRALEVQEATGRPFSFWRKKEAPSFRSRIIGLSLSREELYRRIGERVDRMFEAALVDEVKRLVDMGYARDLPAMSGIGYKEVAEYLAGERTIASAVERTKTGTHRLARHQNAWFKRADKRIQWLDAATDLLERALAAVAEESVPAAEATVWTILFSCTVALRKLRRMAIEITAAGIDVEKVSPALRPK